MFMLIRCIIGALLFLTGIFLIKRSKIHGRRLAYVISTSLSMIITVSLAFLPFENLFLTFDSPEKAYEYVNSSHGEISLVVSGDHSDFVLSEKDDAKTYLIVPKAANGWKVGRGIDTKKIAYKFVNGISVSVYQYKNTGDYFVYVLDTSGGASQITDSKQSDFYSLENNSNLLDKTFVSYYAHISNFDSQYWVIVNGIQIIPLSN